MKTTIQVDDIVMSYAKFGEGNKILVVLPGIYLKSPANNIKALEDTFHDFLKDYTIYLFERRHNPPLNYSLYDMSMDTLKVILNLGISNFDVYGVSQGGMMALTLGVHASNNIHKIAVCSTACECNKDSSVFKNWSKLSKPDSLKEFISSFLDVVYSKNTLEKYRDILIQSYLDTSPEELSLFRIINQASSSFSLVNDLNKIQVPVFVQGSKGDQIFPVECFYQMVDILKCEYYIYDESYGHAVYDENPEVLKKVYAFLSR